MTKEIGQYLYGAVRHELRTFPQNRAGMWERLWERHGIDRTNRRNLARRQAQ